MCEDQSVDKDIAKQMRLSIYLKVIAMSISIWNYLEVHVLCCIVFFVTECCFSVSVLDSPAVDPRSNPGSGSALLMSEKSQAVYYISNYHMLIDKAFSSDKPNGHWFEADWLHCKRDALSSNRKVDGSRLTGSTQACHS